MSDTTDPNRLGPVTHEWVARLERRIEQLELRVGDLEQAPIVDGESLQPGCVPPPLEGPRGDDPCIDLSGE